MPTFERTLHVRAPAEALFWLSQDYGRRLAWDPFLCEARLLGGAERAGVGVRAWCVSRLPRQGMETEYVSFRPPEVAAVRMTRPLPLVDAFAGSWRFAAAPEGGTRVTFRYNVRARPAWLRWVLEPLMLGWFAWESWRRMAAFKRFAEGAPASPLR
jgi:hypothetical protein